VVEDGVPEVAIFAVRESWVRVRSADGTVIYEKVMQPGDKYVLPKTEEPPTLRTGYAGGVYFAVNGKTYGPAGEALRWSAKSLWARARLPKNMPWPI
jgi:hypothetical protein